MEPELTILETSAILSMAAIFELDCDAADEMRDCGWCTFAFVDIGSSLNHLVELGLAECTDMGTERYRLTLAGFTVAAELKVEVK